MNAMITQQVVIKTTQNIIVRSLFKTLMAFQSFSGVSDQLYISYLAKLLLISGHKDLLFNDQVSYTNIFKTSVPSEWFLGLEYFQT